MSSETNAHHSTDPVEVWKEWNETPTRMWIRTPNSEKDSYRDPSGLYNFWMKPAMYFHQWNVAWTQMVGEMVSSEQLLEAYYQSIDTYIRIVRDTSHLVNEVMFPNCGIPTHSEVAQMAKLVVSLEERIYAIEDALVNVEDGSLKVASGQAIEELERHLEHMEGEPDTLNRQSSIPQQTEAPGNLTGYLERMEGKLDILLATLKKIEARVYPEVI